MRKLYGLMNSFLVSYGFFARQNPKRYLLTWPATMFTIQGHNVNIDHLQSSFIIRRRLPGIHALIRPIWHMMYHIMYFGVFHWPLRDWNSFFKGRNDIIKENNSLPAQNLLVHQFEVTYGILLLMIQYLFFISMI